MIRKYLVVPITLYFLLASAYALDKIPDTNVSKFEYNKQPKQIDKVFDDIDKACSQHNQQGCRNALKVYMDLIEKQKERL